MGLTFHDLELRLKDDLMRIIALAQDKTRQDRGLGAQRQDYRPGSSCCLPAEEIDEYAVLAGILVGEYTYDILSVKRFQYILYIHAFSYDLAAVRFPQLI